MNDNIDKLINKYADAIIRKLDSSEEFVEDMVDPLIALSELVNARYGIRFMDSYSSLFDALSDHVI